MRTWARMAASLLVAAAVAYALKVAHRDAPAERFRWLLAPTVRLVEAMGAARFEMVPQEGYLDRAQLFAVVPACAGLNFFIAAFLTAVVTWVRRTGTWQSSAKLMAGAFLGAWVLTVVVNAVRIGFALSLHAHPEVAARLSLSPEEAHRVLGIVVYAGFLFVTHAALVAKFPVRRSA